MTIEIDAQDDTNDYILQYEVDSVAPPPYPTGAFTLTAVWTTDQDGEDIQVEDRDIIKNLDTYDNREYAMEKYHA